MATLADILRQTGYSQDGTLVAPATDSPMTKALSEHIKTLPQQLATNQAALDSAIGSWNKTDFGTGLPNPNYRPEAIQELAQLMPGVMGSIKAVSGLDRMKVAQANAALPISEGGLGLPPNNTAMDRAKALGYTEPAYHGTNADIHAFDPMLADTRRGTGTPMGAVVVTSEPATASTYAGQKPLEWIKSYEEGGNVMPLLINKGKNMAMNARQGDYTPSWRELYHPKYPDLETTNDFALIAKEKGKQSATIKNVKDNAVTSGAEGDTTFIFDPSLIRSKFAAFDPKRIKEADILAAGLAVPMPKSDEKKKRKDLIEEQVNKLKD